MFIRFIIFLLIVNFYTFNEFGDILYCSFLCSDKFYFNEDEYDAPKK